MGLHFCNPMLFFIFFNSFEPMMRIELMTSSLPRKRSTPELHRRRKQLRAGDETRTRDVQLGRLKLYQLSYSRFILLWGEQDSNLRRYAPTDLQSVLVSHLSISPYSSRWRDSNPRPADYKSAALAN